MVNNSMRMDEIEQYWTGWVNLNTEELITHDRKTPHVMAVAENPIGYGITDEILDGSPLGVLIDEFNDGKFGGHDPYKTFAALTDGNRDIVAWMTTLGWVRVIYDMGELNIQGETMRQIWQTAKLMIGKGLHVTQIYYDLKGKAGTGDYLRNDRLEYFLKRGRIPRWNPVDA